MVLILGFSAALVITSGIYIGTVRGATWLMRKIYNIRNYKRRYGIFKKVEV